MKIGKLSNQVLENIIINPIKSHNIRRDEVLITPSVGEDCTALDFKGDICVLSTDPITGAAKDIGKLAIHINANDIASAGGEPIGIMITALLPSTTTESEIAQIMTDIYTEANKAGITVLGGHTEITDCVIRPVLSCTVVGKSKNFISTGGCNVGDSLIMTKWAGLEGTAIIAGDYYDKLQGKVSEKSLKEAAELKQMLSVINEGKIAVQIGVSAMHDVTEGGILGACWEIAKCSNKGVVVYCDNIPILDSTKEICNAVNVDPLRLISSGCMLISTDKQDELLKALKNADIQAAVIGKITSENMLMVSEGVQMPLPEPDCDELYKVGEVFK